MVSDRPYRKGLTAEEVLAELARGAGGQWDPDVVRVFSRILSQDRHHLSMRNSALEVALERAPLAELLSDGTDLPTRETAISMIKTSVRYLAFAIALVLSIVELSGAQRLQTVVGASFLAIVVAFAAQRFLMDVIAGLLMFFEGWFRIGDTVAIDALGELARHLSRNGDGAGGDI